MDIILIRLGEISLKGANRGRFEDALKENIRNFLKKEGINFFGVRSASGRIFIDRPSRVPNLSKVLGIVSYSPAWEFVDIEEVKDFLRSREDIFKGARSFRITASRADKSYPLASPQIAKEVGTAVTGNFPIAVNLKEPEVNVGVEYIEGSFYVYFETIKGWGGLPVGISGKLVVLISGGIDSPVAAFLMMKRGARIIFLHFRRDPEIDKIPELYKILSSYAAGIGSELVVLDMKKINDFYEKIMEDPRIHRYMCVLCKHMMLKAAESLALKKGAMGIVTGDSLAQVASQTLENLKAQRYGLRLPVYSPLIGMDKVEIMKIARSIGTYEVSIKHREIPCPLHRHPTTKADLETFFRYNETVIKKLGYKPWEKILKEH